VLAVRTDEVDVETVGFLISADTASTGS